MKVSKTNHPGILKHKIGRNSSAESEAKTVSENLREQRNQKLTQKREQSVRLEPQPKKKLSRL